MGFRPAKEFLPVAEFAAVEKSVEVVGGKYVVRYTVDGPPTLIGLRRALNHSSKVLYSDATKAAILNLKERPNDFPIELNICSPVYGTEDN